MTTLYYYPFNNTDNMKDQLDNTLLNISNNQYMKYLLSDYNVNSSSYVQFATKQPSVLFSGIVHGNGINGHVVDNETALTMKNTNDRPLEKLQLNQRPFATVPYLGKGGFDPTLESQLQQGEIASDKKSINTITEQSFMGYSLYPTDTKMQERVSNPSYNVEEYALDGWIRGGIPSRELV